MKGSSIDTKTGFDSKGNYQRKESVFRKFIKKDKDAEYPVEAGRYHLYINLACPWAVGCLTVLNIKGLRDVISVSTTKPEWGVMNDEGRKGWCFDKTITCKEAESGDPLFGFDNMLQVYQKVSPGWSDKVTVPVLFDKKTGTIVNNESSEIMKMINSEFNELATKNKDLDLYPE